MAGDDPAMDALLGAGVESRVARDGEDGPVRVVIVPTAAARQRPDLAAAHGRDAWNATGVRAGVEVRVETASIVTRDAAAALVELARLEAADVIHLPGGDPDVIPAVLRDTRAWASILAAHRRGACVAGASAGAMAFGERLWTPSGPVDGLRLVPGLGVVPHFDPSRGDAWRRSVDPDGRLTWLGLPERTLVLGRPGGPWHSVGPEEARWFEPGVSMVVG